MNLNHEQKTVRLAIESAAVKRSSYAMRAWDDVPADEKRHLEKFARVYVQGFLEYISAYYLTRELSAPELLLALKSTNPHDLYSHA